MCILRVLDQNATRHSFSYFCYSWRKWDVLKCWWGPKRWETAKIRYSEDILRRYSEASYVNLYFLNNRILKMQQITNISTLNQWLYFFITVLLIKIIGTIHLELSEKGKLYHIWDFINVFFLCWTDEKVKIANFPFNSRKHQSKMEKIIALMFSDLKKKRFKYS